MQGVDIYDLKQIEVNKGNILHALKAKDEGYVGFGEAYFSTVEHSFIKHFLTFAHSLDIALSFIELENISFDKHFQVSNFASFVLKIHFVDHKLFQLVDLLR